MKWLIVVLVFCSLYAKEGISQTRTFLKSDSYLLYGQQVKLDASKERVFFTLECTIKEPYSQDQLTKIQNNLLKDFEGSQVVQSSTENKVTFITSKEAVGSYSGTAKYVKEKLLQLNLYNGFNTFKETIIELK